MLSDAQVDLLGSHTETTRTIRADVDEWIQEFWLDFDLFNATEVDRAVPLIAGRVEAAQMRVAASTDVYLSSMIAAGTAGVPEVLGVSIEDASTWALRGVAAETVFRRPMTTVFANLAAGMAVDRAKSAGLERLRKIAATDIQLAKTHTAQRRLRNDDKVVGYRRVLNGPKNCGLCIVASTARYHRGDLQPIHPGCDCTVAPITGKTDPGWVIEPEQLDKVHATLLAEFGSEDASARTFSTIENEAVSYRDVLVVHQHGEIGPVLGVRGHSWRSAASYPR